MENDLIKARVEAEQKNILLAQEKIKQLRSICKHEETFKGNYSYRVGVIEERDICKFCGEVLQSDLLTKGESR